MRAFLFDLDETLHDRNGSVLNYIENQYRRYKVESVAFEVYRDRFIELDARGYCDKAQVFTTLVQEFALSISATELLNDFK
jgi:putative hydrolase of the HAD superfamily